MFLSPLRNMWELSNHVNPSFSESLRLGVPPAGCTMSLAITASVTDDCLQSGDVCCMVFHKGKLYTGAEGGKLIVSTDWLRSPVFLNRAHKNVVERSMCCEFWWMRGWRHRIWWNRWNGQCCEKNLAFIRKPKCWGRGQCPSPWFADERCIQVRYWTFNVFQKAR